MKKISIIIGVILLMIPSMAMAAYFMADENVPKGEVVMGNLYLAGGNPTMEGDVQGDLYMSGGNVTVVGNVFKDLVVAGGNVSISGNVNDDLRVFGGSVYIDGRINGEVIAFGGDVKVGPNANIRKDLVIGGGNVNIDDAAKVYGTTSMYTDPESGKMAKEKMEMGFGTIQWMGVVFGILTYLVVAAVFMGIFPKLTSKYLTFAAKKGNFWKSLGLGLLILIVAPIIALFCMITGIGVMLGFIILFLYIMYILINLAMAGVLFGSLAQKWIMKLKKVEMNWLWGLGGIVVLQLLVQIPLLGFFLGAVFFLYSLGAVTTIDWKNTRSVK